MELDYKKLLLELYNASDADALYQLIVSYGLDGSAYWKPYGGNFNNAGILKISNLLLKTLWSKS
jgi:hypothetical protein